MTEEKKVGYAINHIVDYGNGYQIQVAGNLPVGAAKEDFDAELDKVRKAINRQKAFGTKRDMESKIAVEEKLLNALRDGIAETVNGKTTIEKQNHVAKQNEFTARTGNLDAYKALLAEAEKEITGE